MAKLGLKSYLGNKWNYIDLIPPVFIIVVVALDFLPINIIESIVPSDPTDPVDPVDPATPDEPASDDDVANLWTSICETFNEVMTLTFLCFTLQSIACMCMWLKVFYFLRIYRNTGFFVNMLIKVLTESVTFFLLLTLIMAAFGTTFSILQFNQMGVFNSLYYTYLLTLGEFDEDYADYPDSLLLYGFFILGTLLTLVVMLNILIAIISTVYEDVIAVQELANDFERVGLIQEITALIPEEDRKNKCQPNQRLIVARAAKSKNAKFAIKKEPKDDE